MKWVVIRHDCLSLEEKHRIAELKDQHWPYGIDSQCQWMIENVKENDLHLMGIEETEEGAKLRAYATLQKVAASVDGLVQEMIGVGSVCVDKAFIQHGFGKQLMREANHFIHEQSSVGILLCKTILVGFYENCGWDKLEYQHATVAGKPFQICIMTLGNMRTCNEIEIDRNF